MTSLQHDRPQAGFTLAETLVVLGIFSILLPLIWNFFQMGHDALKARQVANHMQAVARATATYVEKHYADLMTTATENSGPTLTVANLINDKFLPAGFTPANAWNQTYTIHIRKPVAGALQSLVLTTGGQTMDKRILNTVVPQAAAMLAGGGFVPTGHVPGQSPDTLQGAFSSYRLAFASMGIVSPGAGHLGVLGSFDAGNLGQDFLYRVAVPGHPELNAMQTELDMRDHAIRGIREAQFVERTITSEVCAAPEEQGGLFLDREQGLYLCRNNALELVSDTGNSSIVKTTLLAENGDMITKPVCPPKTGTVPQIYTSPTVAEAGPVAPPLNAFQTWAVSENDSAWRVHLRILTSDTSLSPDGSGWIFPTGNYAKIMVMTTCAKVKP